MSKLPNMNDRMKEELTDLVEEKIVEWLNENKSHIGLRREKGVEIYRLKNMVQIKLPMSHGGPRYFEISVKEKVS